MEVFGDNPNQWPYIEQTFVAGEVQSPINILSNYSYNASLSSLLYYRYWREESVEIKIGNNGHARKSVSFIFTKIVCKNKFKTNEMIAYFFQFMFIVYVMKRVVLQRTLLVDHYLKKYIHFLTFIYIGVPKMK